MYARLFAFFIALAVTVICSAQVSAQEILTLPAGKFFSIGEKALDPLGDFESAAVTMVSPGAVLYLDGQPLCLYTPLSPAELRRVKIFSSKKNKHTILGVTPLYKQPLQKDQMKIRCINPRY